MLSTVSAKAFLAYTLSASGSTKAWVLKNIISMIALASVAFFMLVVSFETKIHRQKTIRNDALRIQHKEISEMRATSSYTKREIAKKHKEFQWKPIDDRKSCGMEGMQVDPFPESFDAKLYRELNGVGKDYHHYAEMGRKQGLENSRGQHMKDLLSVEILPVFVEHAKRNPKKGNILEVGPFLNPMLKSDQVKYFDVLDLPGLMERARAVGYPAIRPVEIDFVHPFGDLSVVAGNGSFSLVASSNVLPNQANLIRHLNQVAELLQEGGYYALTLVDKRYIFDHYFAETTIADVLDDYYNKRTKHAVRSVIEHRALTVHNDVAKHWNDQHGPIYSNGTLELLGNAVIEHENANGYLDVHNYHFTPQSLAFLVDALYSLGLVSLRVHRLYETLHGQVEFGIVLKKCSHIEPTRKSSVAMAWNTK